MSDLLEGINQNIDEILATYKKVAVVGLSAKPYRASYSVASYLKKHGFEIYPVNPACQEVLGLKCYKSLKEVPGPVEIVDIFRRPENVMPVVEEAIQVGAKVVWMQSGIINTEAARKALAAGLQVVMDACIKIEHSIRSI